MAKECTPKVKFNQQAKIKALLKAALPKKASVIDRLQPKAREYLSKGPALSKHVIEDDKKRLTVDPEVASIFTALGLTAQDAKYLPDIQKNLIDVTTMDKVSLGVKGLMAIRMASMLSSFKTSWVNFIGGGYQLLTTPAIEAVGRAAMNINQPQKIPHEMRMALIQYHAMGQQLKSAMKLASISAKEGIGLWDVNSYSVEEWDGISDIVNEANVLDLGKAWTPNSAPTSFVSTNMHPGLQAMAQWAWKAQSLPLRTLALSDTFWKVLGGNSNHWARKYEEAFDEGTKRNKTGKNLHKFAKKHADFSLKRDLHNVILKKPDGSNLEIEGAAMVNPHALNFSRNLTFTNPIFPEPIKRTLRQGREIAQNRGMKNLKQIDEFAKQYVAEGKAREDFTRMLMGPGRILSAIPHAIDTTKRSKIGPLVSTVAPFIKTPTDIVKSSLRHTPAAPLVDTWMRDINSEDKSTRALALGQVAVGTFVMGSLVYHFINDDKIEISGDGPAGPKANAVWRNQLGKTRRSFRLKQSNGEWGDWISYDSIEPLGSMIAGIADWYDMNQSMDRVDQETTGAAMVLWVADLFKNSGGLGGVVKTGVRKASGIAQNTWLSGIGDFIDALEEVAEEGADRSNIRNPVSKWVQKIGVTMLPYSAMGRKARRDRLKAIEKVPASNFAKEFIDELKATGYVPSWGGDDLPQLRHTITGDIIIPSGSLGRTAIDDSDPAFLGVFPQIWSVGIQSTPTIQTKGLNEIRKHTKNGESFRTNIYTRFVSKTKHVKINDNRMNDVEYDAWVRFRTTTKDDWLGKTLSEALDYDVQSREYKTLPTNIIDGQVRNELPNPQADLLKQTMTKYDKIADERFLASPIGKRIRDNIDYYESNEFHLQNYSEGYGDEAVIGDVLGELSGNK